MRIKNNSILLLLIFITSCNGQNNTDQKDNVSQSKTFSSSEPKLNTSSAGKEFDRVYSNVHQGFEDKAGNIWFGTTDAGTFRYREKLFSHFTPLEGQSNNHLAPLLEDRKGIIWFSTLEGVSYYDPVTNVFTPFPIHGVVIGDFNLFDEAKHDNSPTEVICALEDKTGNIWFGTNDGAYRFDRASGKFTHFLLNEGMGDRNFPERNYIQYIMEDRSGNIWFGSWSRGGVRRYNPASGEIVNFTKVPGLEDDMIHYLLEDKKGNIWIGTRNHGVCLYDPITEVFQNFTENTGLSNSSVYSIIEDKAGNFWFATDADGAWCYDVSTKEYTNFTTKEGLSNNSVFCIVEDKTGNIWFGTRGVGLCRYDHSSKRFTDFTTNDAK